MCQKMYSFAPHMQRPRRIDSGDSDVTVTKRPSYGTRSDVLVEYDDLSDEDDLSDDEEDEECELCPAAVKADAALMKPINRSKNVAKGIPKTTPSGRECGDTIAKRQVRTACVWI